MMKFKLGSAYFAILGVITLVFGGLEVVTGLPGIEGLSAGALEIPPDLWRGIIIFFAGAFITAGAFKLRDIHGLGMSTFGSIMLWIIAGCDIFTRIMESIPNGAGGLNSLEGFLATYGPPYSPALFLLPFSLVIFYFIKEVEK